MLIPSDVIVPILRSFLTPIHRRTCPGVQPLLFGAISDHSKRNITLMIRSIEPDSDYEFAKYCNVLNRAVFTILLVHVNCDDTSRDNRDRV